MKKEYSDQELEQQSRLLRILGLIPASMNYKDFTRYVVQRRLKSASMTRKNVQLQGPSLHLLVLQDYGAGSRLSFTGIISCTR